ncbi:unannotated protein [freshwater metagenome]|uniref:Unannotated protein n=1 Tax=freshwater metagenome TaxID=449393 RepID=A0A6J7EB71_9ZZZZ
MPFVRPENVHEPAAPVIVHVAPPGLAVTVYEVGVAPAAAATVTVAERLPATAVGGGGVPGISRAWVGRPAYVAPQPAVPGT